MADGTYERRGPREAELARLRRILAEESARRERETESCRTGQTNENEKNKESDK